MNKKIGGEEEEEEEKTWPRVAHGTFPFLFGDGQKVPMPKKVQPTYHAFFFGCVCVGGCVCVTLLTFFFWGGEGSISWLFQATHSVPKKKKRGDPPNQQGFLKK